MRSAPDSAIAISAREFAASRCDRQLLAHCDRTYLLGGEIADAMGLAFDEEIAYVAAMLHDLGLTDAAPATARFELEGAVEARSWARSNGLSESDAAVIWDAIALHTTMGIAVAKGPEAAVVHWGAGADAAGFEHARLEAETVRSILDQHPRQGFSVHLEKLLANAIRRAPDAYAVTVWAPLAEAHGIPLVTNADFFAASHFTADDY